MKYKVLVLAIASKSEVYNYFTKIWKAYMNSRPWIKSYLIFGNSSEIRITEDELHLPVQESYIPGILHKTLWGMKWALENFEFDYLLRTNLSSFWILDRIPPYLDRLPDNNIGLSHHMPPLVHGDLGIFNGSGMFFSRDVVENVLKLDEWRYDEPDDREISRQALFKLGVKIYSHHHYEWIANTPEEINVEGNLEKLNQSTEFQIRIKNPRLNDNYNSTYKRMQIDPVIQMALYYHYYGNVPTFKSSEERKLAQYAVFFNTIIEIDSPEIKEMVENSPCCHEPMIKLRLNDKTSKSLILKDKIMSHPIIESIHHVSLF